MTSGSPAGPATTTVTSVTLVTVCRWEHWESDGRAVRGALAARLRDLLVARDLRLLGSPRERVEPLEASGRARVVLTASAVGRAGP